MANTQLGQVGSVEGTLLELDERRRVSLGRIGNKQHKRYLVTEAPDGTLTWRPVMVVALSEIEDPEVRAKVEKSLANKSTTRLVDSLEDL